MNPLRLTPLPSIRANEESGSLLMEREGFVDEDAVLALMSGPMHLRSTAYPEDLALAADDLDFAGWQLPAATLVRGPEFPPQVIDAIVRRRAAPPVIDEPGIGSPHYGSHRWWLAGLAGAMATMLFSLLLVTLSSRPQPIHVPAPLAVAKPTPLPKVEPAEDMPLDLTDASTHRP